MRSFVGRSTTHGETNIPGGYGLGPGAIIGWASGPHVTGWTCSALGMAAETGLVIRATISVVMPPDDRNAVNSTGSGFAAYDEACHEQCESRKNEFAFHDHISCHTIE
jgi:hypothetical protein